MGFIRNLLIVAVLLTLSQSLWAGLNITVKGLFKNQAVFLVDGKTRLLKVGNTSPEGIKLIASSSKQAEVEINGVRQILTLSQHIGAHYQAAKFAEVRIPRDKDSHYRVRGVINGRSVEMMIDTGATMIAMNINDARRLGIDFRNGTRSKTQTAGGIVDTYIVKLSRVSIGSISVFQVSAAIVMGDFPRQILLGNSLLSKVEMTEEAGLLVLRQKF